MIFHNSPNAMARVLVQYIPDDEKIHREIHATYDNAPSVPAIAMFRARYLRAIRNSQRNHDSSVVWMDERYSKDMAEANRRFVSALNREAR